MKFTTLIPIFMLGAATVAELEKAYYCSCLTTGDNDRDLTRKACGKKWQGDTAMVRTDNVCYCTAGKRCIDKENWGTACADAAHHGSDRRHKDDETISYYCNDRNDISDWNHKAKRGEQ